MVREHRGWEGGCFERRVGQAAGVSLVKSRLLTLPLHKQCPLLLTLSGSFLHASVVSLHHIPYRDRFSQNFKSFKRAAVEGSNVHFLSHTIVRVA